GAALTVVGLNNVAVEMQRTLPQRFEVEHSPQTAADEALNSLCAAALLATRCLAIGARVRGARQHAVFGRHPALPLALEKRRHPVEYAGIAQYLGGTH